MTVRPILVVTGLRREARIASGLGVVAIAGGGAPDLAARIEAAIAAHAPAAVVSFGLAGALAPGLEPGDLTLGRAVVVGEGRFESDAEWRATIAVALGGEAREALVLGADAMITDAAEKQALHARTGAGIVDMESAAAARAAAAHGLPFAVIRAVSDSAARTLPPAVLSGMKPDGGMDLMGVLKALARQPRQLPDLIRAGQEAERGFKALERASLRLHRSGALAL